MNAVQNMDKGRVSAARRTVGRGLGMLLAAGSLLTAVQPVRAIPPIFWSGVDWRKAIDDYNPFQADSIVDGIFFMTDRVDFGVVFGGGVGAAPFHGGGVAFFTAGTQGVPEGFVLVTTVYGIDSTPTAPLVSLTGFTATGPRLVPQSVETITSRGGSSYTSGARINVPVSGLASFLPGHDLSWFAGANPNSTVFAFQTYAPYGEFYFGTTPVCLADANDDGTVDGSDFVAFINSFAIGNVAIDAVADVAGGGTAGNGPDGTIDGSDFVAFINAFALGC